MTTFEGSTSEATTGSTAKSTSSPTTVQPPVEIVVGATLALLAIAMVIIVAIAVCLCRAKNKEIKGKDFTDDENPENIITETLQEGTPMFDPSTPTPISFRTIASAEKERQKRRGRA